MAKFNWTPGYILTIVFLHLILPIVYVFSFNSLFGTMIPYTIDTWIQAFAADLLAVIAFIVILVVGLGLGKAWGPFAFLFLVVGILLLPVLFIFMFNLFLSVAVPYTLETYALVAAVLFMTIAGSTLAQKIAQPK